MSSILTDVKRTQGQSAHTGVQGRVDIPGDAVALSYSDPSVSTMLVELAKEGYLQTAVSPEHARKRLVSITAKGSEVVAQGRQLLDAHFDQLMQAAGIDVQHYRDLNEQVYLALVAKMKKEHS